MKEVVLVTIEHEVMADVLSSFGFKSKEDFAKAVRPLMQSSSEGSSSLSMRVVNELKSGNANFILALATMQLAHLQKEFMAFSLRQMANSGLKGILEASLEESEMPDELKAELRNLFK